MAADVQPLLWRSLSDTDPEVAQAVAAERVRQNSGLELIASENFVSRAVLEAAGSVLTNKYAEGYPGRRYYGGCQFVDVAETLAIERVKKLFGAGFANVQPHSGAQANAAAFMALMQPGDTFMGLNLAAGGHLTHGSPVNMSGKWFKVVPYTVRREDQRIDMAEVERLAHEHKPKVIVTGGSAYPRVIDFRRFREIADSVGAKLMVDMAHFAGLVAGGVHPSPFPHAHVVTSTTHKTLRGPRGGFVLTNDEDLAKKINHELDRLFPKSVEILAEPGRFLVGNAGMLVTEVLYRKQTGKKHFTVVDAGMNDLIRPTLYEAFHQIEPVGKPRPGAMATDVVGPVCESGDVFGHDRTLPPVERGDRLAILSAGAYGFAMASNYNTRPRPAEILVTGNRAKVVRVREELADLWRGERKS